MSPIKDCDAHTEDAKGQYSGFSEAWNPTFVYATRPESLEQLVDEEIHYNDRLRDYHIRGNSQETHRTPEGIAQVS